MPSSWATEASDRPDADLRGQQGVVHELSCHEVWTQGSPPPSRHAVVIGAKQPGSVTDVRSPD
jgi:hypothetical protein